MNERYIDFGGELCLGACQTLVLTSQVELECSMCRQLLLQTLLQLGAVSLSFVLLLLHSAYMHRILFLSSRGARVLIQKVDYNLKN